MSSAVMPLPSRRRLGAAVEVRLTLDSRDVRVDPAAAVRELIQTMEELLWVLRAYFFLEESDDHAGILEIAPWLDRRVSSLQDEHRDILARLERFLSRVKPQLRRAVDHATCDRIFAWFDQFERELCEHEAREREVLSKAYCDDIGVAD